MPGQACARARINPNKTLSFGRGKKWQPFDGAEGNHNYSRPYAEGEGKRLSWIARLAIWNKEVAWNCLRFQILFQNNGLLLPVLSPLLWRNYTFGYLSFELGKQGTAFFLYACTVSRSLEVDFCSFHPISAFFSLAPQMSQSSGFRRGALRGDSKA